MGCLVDEWLRFFQVKKKSEHHSSREKHLKKHGGKQRHCGCALGGRNWQHLQDRLCGNQLESYLRSKRKNIHTKSQIKTQQQTLKKKSQRKRRRQHDTTFQQWLQGGATFENPTHLLHWKWKMIGNTRVRHGSKGIAWMSVSSLTEEGSTLRRSDLGDEINNESRLLNIVINYESLYGGDID